MIKFMFLFLCFLNTVNMQDSSCGCGVNRLNNKIGNSIMNTNFQDLDQCLVKENNYNYSMVFIPSGLYQLGTDNVVIESDKEGPKRMVKIKEFYIDKFEVSNKEFNNFVKSTNYKTEAEVYGDSFVFSLFLNSTFKESKKDFRVAQAVWWYKIAGTDWQHPYGPDSSVESLIDHPVIHVSWNDAKAFCAWRGARLPTEAEWEAACRASVEDTNYPWGNKLFPNKKYMANIWQGTFPSHNSAKDGFVGTNPVNMFAQNDLGLHNMAGNVWEWMEDSWTDKSTKEKVKKGGSYLCHSSYCYRYRCSARSHNTEDSSAGNLGFRCAKSK